MSGYDVDAFSGFSFAEGPFGGAYYVLPTIASITGVDAVGSVGLVGVEVAVDLFGVEALGETGSVITASTVYDVDTFSGFSFAEGPFGGSLYTLPLLYELVGVTTTGAVGSVGVINSGVSLTGVDAAGQAGD